MLLVSQEDMEQALSEAVPGGPASLPQPDAGAVLALACHCIMVAAGMQCIVPDGGNLLATSRFTPPPRWAIELKDEWVFRYTMAGKRNILVLHCSLQRVSGRMLVHTIEVNNDRNSHLLGLLLEKYIPDLSLLSRSDWTGLLHNSSSLAQMLTQHLLQPLVDQAEDVPIAGDPQATADWAAEAENEKLGHIGVNFGLTSSKVWKEWWNGSGQEKGAKSYVVPAVVLTGLAVAAVAVFIATKRQRR